MPKSTQELRQVATRIPTETWEILNVGLTIERAPSMQELLRPVIEEYARRLAKEPEVRSIRGEVEKYRARKHGAKRPKRRSKATRTARGHSRRTN